MWGSHLVKPIFCLVLQNAGGDEGGGAEERGEKVSRHREAGGEREIHLTFLASGDLRTLQFSRESHQQ